MTPDLDVLHVKIAYLLLPISFFNREANRQVICYLGGWATKSVRDKRCLFYCSALRKPGGMNPVHFRTF